MEAMDVETIFWDFDGVLMASNEIRDRGFERVLADFPDHEVDKLLAFHQANGGLSRYVKFRYFFEEVQGEENVTDEQIQRWANRFSEVMLQHLKDSELLIEETVSFVKREHENYNMHVVSGSDGEELREICTSVGLSPYFRSIHGSPTPKTELVSNLIAKHQYDPGAALLIGDSINDYEAAEDNNIAFMGYGNEEIKKYTTSKMCLSKP